MSRANCSGAPISREIASPASLRRLLASARIAQPPLRCAGRRRPSGPPPRRGRRRPRCRRRSGERLLGRGVDDVEEGARSGRPTCRRCRNAFVLWRSLGSATPWQGPPDLRRSLYIDEYNVGKGHRDSVFPARNATRSADCTSAEATTRTASMRCWTPPCSATSPMSSMASLTARRPRSGGRGPPLLARVVGQPHAAPPEARPPVCLTVTHLDSLVLARCGFNHSVDYRRRCASARRI